MIGLGMSSEKDTPSVAHVQVVALYEPDTGRIQHLHMVTTLSGAEPVAQEDAIAEAISRARPRNPQADSLAIALSNDIEHGLQPHCIDPKTKAFVPLPAEKRAE